MRLLLDSHVLFWAIYGPNRLSKSAASAIAEPDSDLYVSLASIWELSNKAALGRLPAAGTSVQTMIGRIRDLNVTILPITESDVVQAATLPAHHLDPFDRMLIAQARSHELTLITADSQISKYDLPILWR